MAKKISTATLATTGDVNKAFDGEKLRQMASQGERMDYLNGQVEAGRMRVQSTDGTTTRFEVLTGYDKGEIFVATATTVEANHGLDLKANGETALYLMSNEPAWHALGQVVPEGLRTGTEVLSAAGLLWTTEQAQSSFVGPDGIARLIPDSFVNYRSDTFAPLGTVGKIYHPFHNHVAYSILDELLGYGMIAKSAGSFRGGRKVFVSAEIPSDLVIKGANGVEDIVKQFITLVNTHDGNGSLVVARSPWFPRCQNTANLAIREADVTYKIRHTKGGINKIEEARKVFGFSQVYFEEFVKEETALANADFTSNDLDDLINGVWADEIKKAEDDNSARGKTIQAQRRDNIHGVWAMELERLGGTAFAAENAITGYLDHGLSLRPRGELKGGQRGPALGQAILEGSLDEKKNKAHAMLMNRVR